MGNDLETIATQTALLNQLRALASQMLFDPVRKRMADEQERPLCQHLADYREVMASRGKPKHVDNAGRRVQIMLRLCRARTWPELSKSRVEVAFMKLRAIRCGRKTFSSATLNHYLNSMKGFCNWMVDDFRAERSPCRGIKPLAKTDVRKKRRALTHDETLRLFEAATAGRAIAGIPGPERALSYILATTTGLRSNELQSLTRASFHLAGPAPYVVVLAAYTKNGKRAEQPLRADVAELVKVYLVQTLRDEKLFRRPVNGMLSLRKDLKAAGIEYRINGEDADFHAQRHTFVSNLFDSGATPKEAQTLARHQDARLTLSRYAHVSASKQRAAVERLPGLIPLEPPRMDAGSATHGTTHQPGRMEQHG